MTGDDSLTRDHEHGFALFGDGLMGRLELCRCGTRRLTWQDGTVVEWIDAPITPKID